MTQTESGEWVRVLDVTFSRHDKAGRPPCLCVEYSTESGMFRDHVPIEHNTQHAAAISAKGVVSAGRRAAGPGYRRRSSGPIWRAYRERDRGVQGRPVLDRDGPEVLPAAWAASAYVVGTRN